MELFTGGSMFVRAPQRTYQLAACRGVYEKPTGTPTGSGHGEPSS